MTQQELTHTPLNLLTWFSFLTVWHWLDRDALSRKKAFEPFTYNAEDCEPARIEHARDKGDVLSIVN